MMDRVGETFITNEGYKILLIVYRSAKDCDVKFDSGYISINLTYDNIKKGKVKNPYHPSVYNIGYISIGKYLPSINGDDTKEYIRWRDMLKRCYCLKYQKNNPSYIGCTVDKRWHNFQIFAEWFEENYTESYHLDKDILVKGNKVYSSETCCFVPRVLNNHIVVRSSKTSVKQIPLKGKCTNEEYKEYKEKEIKRVANIWWHEINEEVYQALINYKI